MSELQELTKAIKENTQLQKEEAEKWDEWRTCQIQEEPQEKFYKTWEFRMDLAQFIALFFVAYTNAYSMNRVVVPTALANFLNNIPFPATQIAQGFEILLIILLIYTIYKIYLIIHNFYIHKGRI
jgi:hypothetical protein